MKSYDEMNGHEKIAYHNIIIGLNYEMDSWYNYYQDGEPEYIPDTVEKAKEEIYECIMSNTYIDKGSILYGKAPKEMRFAGETFIRELIDYLFETEDSVADVADIKHWRI